MSTSVCLIYYSRKGCVQSDVTSLNVWEISDNISVSEQDSDIVTMEHLWEIVCGQSNGTVANAVE